MRFYLSAVAATALVAGGFLAEATAQDGLQIPGGYAASETEAITFVSDDAELVSYCGEWAEPACGCPTCGDDACAGCGDDVAGCGDGVGCGSACGAKAKKKPSPCLTSHKGVYYANDFSYLKDPCYRGSCLGDRLKLMPVGPCGKYGTLDVGGQLRFRYHHEEGMGRSRALPGRDAFNDTKNDLLLSRLRLYGNWKVNDNVRVFAEGIFADVTSNADYDPRPIDENYGDFLNLFVDLKLTDEFLLRIGRQELLFGSERLISPLDWANTRRTFEGIRGTYRTGDWTVDGFYTNFVPVNNDQFDEADYDQSFYGVYSNYAGLETANLDLYYIGFDNQTVGTPIATDFSVHTFGGRLNGKAAGKWLYDVEGAYQGGRQSGLGQDHDAGFITGGIGRALTNMPWNPTLWMYFDYASGNHAGGDFNRFNQLFPLAHKYLGFIDAVERANIISPNVLLTMAPTNKWKLLMWYYYLGADTPNDDIPPVATPANQLLGQEDFGSELDFIARYQIAPRSNILFGYSHLWRGSRIIGDTDASFFYSQWELNF